MIISQIGIAISANSILLETLPLREPDTLAGRPAETALTSGPDTG